jgi:hypothetical protein
MILEPFRTLGQCSPPCRERLEAIIEDRFGPAKSLGGWVFREGPYRMATWRARYYGMEDHSGEPFSFVSCPFCGGELPPPPDDEGLHGSEDGG